MEGNQQDAKRFLESKGFNISDDMTVKALDNNTYTITKIVQNVHGEEVPMEIMLEKNIWEKSGKPRNPNLSTDDLYIIQVTNGTVEQERSKDNSYTNRGKGIFTKFIYDVVGNKPCYVKDASPYWGRRFELVEDLGKGRYFFGLIRRRNGNGIKKYKKPEEVSGGTRRRRRRRRKTRVVKRNKKKRMTRKIKKRKRTTKKRKGTRRYY